MSISPVLSTPAIVSTIMFLVSTCAYCQNGKSEEEHNKPHHRISIMLSHTHVPKAINDESVIVPSWGLNYEYWFNNKWAVGLHSDVEIATYIIKSHEGQELEREKPLIVSLVGIYNPWKGFELLAGFGKEYETHANFWVYRFGIEYELEIASHWDLAPSLIYDIKEDLYDSWTLGLVVGKRF